MTPTRVSDLAFGQLAGRRSRRLAVTSLYRKEVQRFMKVQAQTIWAPAFMNIVLLAVFAIVNPQGRAAVLGVDYLFFLAPGLIAAGMIQNSFANSSSSIMSGKTNGGIVDMLMAPLSPADIIAGHVGAAMTRGWLVGLATWLVMVLWMGSEALLPREPLLLLLFGTLAMGLLGLLGLLTGIWAEKFEHMSAVTSFVIQPLSLLSGTFYALDTLPEPWITIAYWNPFHMMIGGIRAGFIGTADFSLLTGAAVLLLANLVLGTVTWLLLRRGWRLKA
ncbi:ABC transporter permease [Niveispirillum fermenti]|uniref:ABC transporter permease n=1 Tax=Niveispirillum fermenti TaxID=1233113 RepID=UPI003A8A21A7